MNRNSRHKRVYPKVSSLAPPPVFFPKPKAKPVAPVVPVAPVAPVAPFIPSAPEPEVVYSYDPPVRSKSMQLSEPVSISLPRMITPIAPHIPYFVAAPVAKPVPVAKPIPIVKAAPVPVSLPEPPAGTRAHKIWKFISTNFKS
jgi:hypothetical protein